MKQIFIAIVLLVSVVVSTAAPTMIDKRPSVKDWIGGMGRSSAGLIDPSRLTVNHGVSFGASFGGGSSLMSGLYQTHLKYQLSNPLTLSLSLGLQNLKYGDNPVAQNSIIAGFGIDYKPTKNFHLRLQMQQIPFGSYLNRNLNQTNGFGIMESNFLTP